jgi:23S rRNA pseudouridine1911/1915/1917 synthase
MNPPFPILYEDNHLLVISKPAGLATMGVDEATPSAVTLAKEYLRQRYNKPGNVYLGVVSRLDAAATGALVFARTSKAAARLSEFFRSRTVEKTYWAMIEGRLAEATGIWSDHLAKQEARQRVERVAPHNPGAQLARLTFRRLRWIEQNTWVEVQLETGRKHQIRVQFALRRHPILGDRKYGSRIPFPTGIALHSRRLAFEHPVQKTPLEFIAPLPASWKSLHLPESSA